MTDPRKPTQVPDGDLSDALKRHDESDFNEVDLEEEDNDTFDTSDEDTSDFD